MTRGVLYIVWGESINRVLNRSLESLKAHHPELSVYVHRVHGDGTLRPKLCMNEVSPFDTTLFLDADTIVMGRLDYAFEKAERFGLACCICEAPWLRRYGHEHGDLPEYNTGVIFWNKEKASGVFDRWATESEGPSKSTWKMGFEHGRRGLEFDDQAGFSRAVEKSGINPHVLPLGWNLRPDWFHKRLFAPVKIWHGYDTPPEWLRIYNNQVQNGLDSVRLVDL